MASFDSAYLLAWYKRVVGRSPAGDPITDANEYLRLTESQNRVIADMAARVPQSLYSTAPWSSYPTLATSDNQYFTFGTDANGYPIAPIGKTKIYPTIAAIPDSPWTEGADYLQEGNHIRIPNNRTYVGTLYWRGVTQPADIAAATQPALLPEASRELIVWDAARAFAQEGGRNPELAAQMDANYTKAFARWCLVWKTQFASGGALAPLTATMSVNPSWTGP